MTLEIFIYKACQRKKNYNLKLPSLIDERKSIKKEITDAKDQMISERLLKKYYEITREIKAIQNKDIQ